MDTTADTEIKKRIRKLVRETLEQVGKTQEQGSMNDPDLYLLQEKIIITYDAGKEFKENEHKTAKAKIITDLHKLGVRKFHSPTRSTIVFTIPEQNSFFIWHAKLKKLFDGYGEDFYYSMGYITAGLQYDDKANLELNDGIQTILDSLS